MMNPQSMYAIQSTAGAVPVTNAKGEITMQKVKVHRYVSGKKPDYAQDVRSDSDSDSDDFIERRNQRALAPSPEPAKSDDELNDPRLRRLKIAEVETEVRPERRRHVVEPEVLESSEDEKDEEVHLAEQKHMLEAAPDEDESEDELSDTEIERRREVMKQRILTKQDDEFMKKEEEEHSHSETEESSESEEYSDSEEETGPRLKPVFVRKRDRVTIIEKEKELQKQKKQEEEALRQAEERRRHTLKMVEESVRKEQQPKEKNEPHIDDVCTDDENDEVEYEAWKLRELKRIKRDREEREAIEREKLEIEKFRTMTEEERRIQLRLNPKLITNKATKGKYKFLQKYYHRGAFYLDKDDEVFKRDFAQATLEDHFDKTILPKVMQVKNFGRSGRTKYTHLVDQDTTQFDSPWSTENSQNLKFHSQQSGGVKPVFDRPSLKKRKV